jgi:pilus assembly protein Flp/PilA
MQRLTAILKEFAESDDGVTAMEYALLSGLIAVVIVLAVTNVGTSVNALFSFVSDEVENAVTTAGL